MMALSCQCVSFMPSLFSNFLNSPSLISPQCSSASSLSSPFHLEHWHPPSPSSSVIVFHRRRMTESASRFSHHTKTSCQLLLLISSKCATSRPPSPAHFIAKLSSCSLFFLSFLLWFHCSLWTRHKVGAVVFFPLILDILVWRLIITIGCPHSSPSLPSSQRTWSHFSYQHCLNTWTFFFFFYTKFIHKIQKHYMIFTGQHYVARRKYVGSLKMWLCGLLELHQITGIIKLSFLTLAVCYPPTLDFHVRVCI